MSDKIRTKEHLQNAMEKDFSWRKKELHAIKSMVASSPNADKQEIFIRSAIPLLYAHWEGLVKRIGTCYVEFVYRQKLRYNDLSPNFLAIVVGSMVGDIGGLDTRMSPCLEIVKFFQGQLDDRSRVPWKTAVQTKSNLSSARFKEVVLALGLDYTKFATKERLVDEKLVDKRNHIAHGRNLAMNIAEYIELHDSIYKMMEDFVEEVEHAYVNDRFRQSPPATQS